MSWAILAFQIMLLVLPARYLFERLKPFKDFDRNQLWSRELRRVGTIIPASEKAVVFGSRHPIEAMFYINHSVYPELPEPKTVSTLKERGYAVYVLSETPEGALAVSRL